MGEEKWFRKAKKHQTHLKEENVRKAKKHQTHLKEENVRKAYFRKQIVHNTRKNSFKKRSQIQTNYDCKYEL